MSTRSSANLTLRAEVDEEQPLEAPPALLPG
jgi:hypothetical protein